MANPYPIDDNPDDREKYKKKWLYKLLTHGNKDGIWQNPLIKGASYTAGVCFTLFVARMLLYLILSLASCSWLDFTKFMSSFNLLGS